MTKAEYLEDIHQCRQAYEEIMADYASEKALLPAFSEKLAGVFQQINGYPLKDLKKKIPKMFRDHADYKKAADELDTRRVQHKCQTNDALLTTRLLKSRARKDLNNAISRFELACENERLGHKRARIEE